LIHVRKGLAKQSGCQPLSTLERMRRFGNQSLTNELLSAADTDREWCKSSDTPERR
jgi:hypothetical protein